MLCGYRYHHSRVFGTLRFVHRDGISQDNFIEFGEIVQNSSMVKLNLNCFIFGVDALDPADITIEDQFVIVIFDLHDLVIGLEIQIAAGDDIFTRIEGLLQSTI